ncbi:MAG: hypothetical protein QF376_01300 [Anaerolineales bacterium]|nr:hypothetical protein [Anaerolineales bacterium]
MLRLSPLHVSPNFTLPRAAGKRGRPEIGGGGLWSGRTFTNAVGALVESESYYPAIPTERSRVAVS